MNSECNNSNQNNNCSQQQRQNDIDNSLVGNIHQRTLVQSRNPTIPHHWLQNSTIPPIRSLECKTPVKIILHNQSERKVLITWLNYIGHEVVYFSLGPNCKYVIDSYVTHPWIFRDVKRKNLAIIDALVADRKDLIILNKRNLYNKKKRFQVASRIFFPKAHNQPENFLMVIIKNGVHSLQEICMNTMIDRLFNDQTKMKEFQKKIPKHLRETFDNYLKGQNIMEFFDNNDSLCSCL